MTLVAAMFSLQQFQAWVQSFSVLCIPTGDTHITSDMCMGIQISRGYTYHCDTCKLINNTEVIILLRFARAHASQSTGGPSSQFFKILMRNVTQLPPTSTIT